MPCGFESHLSHQKKTSPNGLVFFWCKLGLEEGGLALGQGKKVSGGHFFSPGESPLIRGRTHMGVDTDQNFPSAA